MSVPTRAKVRPNSIGRKGKFRLAAACADLMSDDDVAWWLREVMAGRDPDAPRDDDGNLKMRPGDSYEAPDWKDRLSAAAMFLNRRNGMAPQQVVIEAELQATVRQAGQIPAAQRKALGTDERNQLRGLLRKVTGAPALPGAVTAARDANPIDAASTEVE